MTEVDFLPFASAFLQVWALLSSGRRSCRCPPLWSPRHPARNISTSLPPPPPLTRPQTKKRGRADGRRLTPLTPCSLIPLRHHPALTCPLRRRRRPPRTPTPTITTMPSRTCHSPRRRLPSLLSLPSRPLTAKNERSSSAGTRKRRLGWRKRGTAGTFLGLADSFYVRKTQLLPYYHCLVSLKV